MAKKQKGQSQVTADFMQRETLAQILSQLKRFHQDREEVFKNKVPKSLYPNLRAGYGEREYQKEAFGRFAYYFSEYPERPINQPLHLLFHMATGSGKTLIMAGLILFLNEHGYRNFLFFVNSTNIINKTRNNFLNPRSPKYLFAETIRFGDKQMRIREVENFDASNEDDINVVFNTIQLLHIRLNTPHENSITYEDFADKKIVLISDEAHHINADTKNANELNQEELFELTSWESTVLRLFKSHDENIMLEFTATMDFNDEKIAEKYFDKLMFDYPLRQFRTDGFSKEVKVMQTDLEPFERALQGIVLSQYRRKIFERHHLRIKPVILFKSKTIAESTAFYSQFIDGIQSLSEEKLQELRNVAQRNAPQQQTFTYTDSGQGIERAFDFFERNNITLENLILELQNDFVEEKCLVVNSKVESEEKQIAVNTLEDESNEYRAVFAVDKLNEGWDVLNLFDIVRLYDTRDAKAGQPGKTTMAEAQLIGRGARYCPFQLSPDDSLYSRKFDSDLQNEMRVCEELYYHSAYNPRYVQELHTALVNIGMKHDQQQEIELTLKESFKQTEFYKAGLMFLNELVKYEREEVETLDDSIRNKLYKVALLTGVSRTTIAFSDDIKSTDQTTSKVYKLYSFGPSILRKAMNKLGFYNFATLHHFFPKLSSSNEFIESENYLKKISVEITATPDRLVLLSRDDKLSIAVHVLDEIQNKISTNVIEYKGSREFRPYLIRDKVTDKTLMVAIGEGSDKERGVPQTAFGKTNYYLDLTTREWYVFNDNYGTSEEKSLVKYIDRRYDELHRKFREIYLVRNERHFPIFTFDNGQRIEPDFVLFLVRQTGNKIEQYQIFIEPKGKQLIEVDRWKEQFLKRLKEEHRIEQLWRGHKYVVWGMPFYNEDTVTAEFARSEFFLEFEKVLSA